MPIATLSPAEQRAAGASGIVLPAIEPEDRDRYYLHWCKHHCGQWLRGTYEIPETDATDRKRLVAGIAAGQWEDIEAIRCGNEALGSFANVTRDIADEVLQHCIDEQVSLSPGLRNWLHTYVGVRAVENAVEEYPYLDGTYYAGWR